MIRQFRLVSTHGANFACSLLARVVPFSNWIKRVDRSVAKLRSSMIWRCSIRRLVWSTVHKVVHALHLINEKKCSILNRETFNRMVDIQDVDWMVNRSLRSQGTMWIGQHPEVLRNFGLCQEKEILFTYHCHLLGYSRPKVLTSYKETERGILLRRNSARTQQVFNSFLSRTVQTWLINVTCEHKQTSYKNFWDLCNASNVTNTIRDLCFSNSGRFVYIHWLSARHHGLRSSTLPPARLCRSK